MTETNSPNSGAPAPHAADAVSSTDQRGRKGRRAKPPDETEVLIPIERPPGRRTAVEIHSHLRGLILAGRIPPSTILSQQVVARQLGVSRTPVREALRKLQEEGLLVGEPNYRARVASFDPNDLESLWTLRVMIEPFLLGLSVERMGDRDFDEIEGQMEVLQDTRCREDFSFWLGQHRRFHLMLLSAGDTPLLPLVESSCERAERYLHLFHDHYPAGWWMSGAAEHRTLIDACRSRDVAHATTLLAQHIGRTALDIAAARAPDHDPRTLKASLSLVLARATAGELSGAYLTQIRELSAMVPARSYPSADDSKVDRRRHRDV